MASRTCAPRSRAELGHGAFDTRLIVFSEFRRVAEVAAEVDEGEPRRSSAQPKCTAEDFVPLVCTVGSGRRRYGEWRNRGRGDAAST